MRAATKRAGRLVGPVLRSAIFTLAVAADANAVTVVEFIWTATTGAGATGSANIGAQPGDRITGEIRIFTSDPSGITAYAISLTFDSDFGDELDLVAVDELLPAGFTHNLNPGPEATQESTAGLTGAIRSVEALTVGPGVSGVSFAAARLTFDVTGNVVTDGNDVATGAFSPGVDGLGNGVNFDITHTVVFLEAAVNLVKVVPAVPSWGIPALVAMLTGLGLAASARRSSRARRD